MPFDTFQMNSMTPHERADYLIKECGSVDSAIAHVVWVLNGRLKKITKEYWEEVLTTLEKKKLSHS